MADAPKKTCECGYALRGLISSRPLSRLERAAFLVTGGAAIIVCPECGLAHRVMVKPVDRHRSGRDLARTFARLLLDWRWILTLLLLAGLGAWFVVVVRWLVQG